MGRSPVGVEKDKQMGDTTRQYQYLTPREMAELTGFPIGVFRQAISGGEMPALRLGRGRSGAMHVRREAFDQWLRQKESAYAEGHDG